MVIDSGAIDFCQQPTILQPCIVSNWYESFKASLSSGIILSG